MQQIVAAELAGDDLGGDKAFWADRRQQIIDEDRLARPNLAGDDDEPFGVVQAIDHIGHRLAMHAALEKEARIGGQLKRPRRKPVKFGIHGSKRLGQVKLQRIRHDIAGSPVNDHAAIWLIGEGIKDRPGQRTRKKIVDARHWRLRCWYC